MDLGPIKTTSMEHCWFLLHMPDVCDNVRFIVWIHRLSHIKECSQFDGVTYMYC